jgi:Ca2+-binding RTX toxin-like protein
MPQTPITDLIKVNTTVADAQFSPAVAALSGGGYVIVWEDFSAGRIFAQRFSAAGAKVGNEIQLDSTQGGSPLWVSVAATAADGFVIAFQAGSFAQAEIFARRYDSVNNPVGGLFAVNTTSPNEQFNPHITALDGGNLLFTWDTQAFDVFQEVRGRIFTSDGQALGQDFVVAPVSATDQHGLSAITSLAGGGFVVTWQRAANSGTNFEIVGQRFTSGGAAVGGQFTANTQTTNNQYGNDVARLSDGGFVVSWTDPVPSNGGGRIVARHYDVSGNAIGGEIVIDSKASGAYGRTTVTATANGGYVVSWTEDDGTAAQNNVLARQIAANDLPVGPTFEMSFNSPFGANNFSDGAVTLSNGNIVFTWDGPSTNTSQDIYTRQYSFTTASTTPTEGDDLLSDTAGNDTINALGGNDTIAVTNGRDTVNGGAGNDVLIIDYGTATTGAGTYAGPTANPNGGFDGGITVDNPQISSRLVAFTGIERFIVTTGSAADDITVASGNDEVRTGAGNDRVNVGSGVDIADGGADVDAISADLSGLAAGATINLGNAANTGAYGTYSNFEYFGTITGSGFDDVFVTTGVAQIDTVDGGAGNDQITVSNGRDIVNGGTGNDTLILDYGAATGTIGAFAGPTANPNGGFDGGYSEGPTQVASRQVSYTGIERFVFRLGAANDVLTIATPLDDADGGAGTDTLSGNFAGGPAVDINLGTSTRFANFEAFGTITGSNFADRFVTTTGQFNETLTLGDGDDVVTLFNGRDTVSGGAGTDTLIVNYSTATAAVSNDPALTVNPNGGFDGAFAEGPGQVASRITLFTGFERFDITGGSGNDNLTTGSGDDRLDLASGGNDSVSGGAGNDGFFFGAAFAAADTVDGGSGSNDQVGLQGNYAAGLTLGAATLTNVEVVAVLPGFSYNLTTNDANVAAGQTLTFFGGNLGAGENFTVDGSAETNGNFRMYGGLGNDTFTGAALDDGFYFGPGKWGAGDSVVGGGGANDQLALDGDYSVSIGASADVETLILLPGPTGSPNTFNITLTDVWTAAAATKTVWGLNVTTAMTINGSAESNGNLIFFGGQGSDTLTGGAGADTIFGGGGGDALRGNSGADVFRYDNLSDSTGTTDATRDRILDFSPGDKIDLSRIDAITGGADDPFSFIGSAAFSGGGTSAGQLRYTDAGGGIFFLEGDVNGDGIADFTLNVTMTPATLPVATDFVL